MWQKVNMLKQRPWQWARSANVSGGDVIFVPFHLELWNTNDSHTLMQTDTYRCLKRLPSLLFSFNELLCLRANRGEGWLGRVDWEGKGESVHVAELSYLRTNERRVGQDDARKPNGQLLPSLCNSRWQRQSKEWVAVRSLALLSQTWRGNITTVTMCRRTVNTAK